MRKAIIAAALASALFCGSAQAAFVNEAVPTNATISYNGLQWAWASPLGPTSIDLSYQSQFGWRLPTAEELTNAPTARMFIYDGANAIIGGASDPLTGANWQYFEASLSGLAAALATPYFSNFYRHGDFCNGQGSACSFGEVAWNGPSFNETLVVRSLQNGVPEPATWALMILGFGAVGGAMRRRQSTSATVRLA